MKNKLVTFILVLGVMLFFAAGVASASTDLVQPRTYTTDADFDEGLLEGVNHEVVHDQLQLNREEVRVFPFAWIANSGEGTVSKIDTTTGTEVARYRTGPGGGAESPSRTAVDKDGNCWVANRAFGGQGSVVKILESGGVDRNGNGVIDTSTGPDDVKPWGEDERVVLSTPVGGWNGVPRAIAIDKEGDIWVGLHNERKYVVLDKETGAQIAEVPVNGCPYGAVIDTEGILWSWSGCLEKIDTNARVYLGNYNLPGGYGITVDAEGFVWLGAYPAGGVLKFNPGTGTVQHFPTNETAGRGVCVTPNGHVWVALGYGWPNNKVAKFDSNGNLLGIYDVGSNPCGVGVDYDGNILVVCQDSNNVYKLKEDDGTVVWITPVGATPYTYSDFTGYSLRGITQNTGSWTVIYDGGIAGTNWGKASWTSEEPAGTMVVVKVRSADEKDALSSQPWLNVENNTYFGPVTGRYIELRARLTTTSEVSPVLYDLTIEPLPYLVVNAPDECIPAEQMFTVAAEVKDVENMYGADVCLKFDPKFLEAMGVKINTDGVFSLGGTTKIDNGGGDGAFNASRNRDDYGYEGYYGDAVLAWVDFRAKRPTYGKATCIHFESAELVGNKDGADSPVYSLPVNNWVSDCVDICGSTIEGKVKPEVMPWPPQWPYWKDYSGTKVYLEDLGGAAIAAFETYTDAEGNYSLINPPPGVYNVVAERGGYLSKAAEGIQVDGTNYTRVDFLLLTGDITQDNAVDIDDLNVMRTDYGTWWNIRSDLDYNGWVNIRDLVYLARNYTAYGYGYPGPEK